MEKLWPRALYNTPQYGLCESQLMLLLWALSLQIMLTMVYLYRKKDRIILSLLYIYMRFEIWFYHRSDSMVMVIQYSTNHEMRNVETSVP